MADGGRGRLSSSLGQLEPYYDVVVVGSGYGGAVAAARLAGRGKRVCVLERGRELQPGDYPDTLTRALREFQVDLPGRHLFSPTALYDLRINPGLGVFVGCGLGGTSLINAGVMLEPDAAIFTDGPWPKRLRREARTGQLDRWFRAAEWMLEPSPHPGRLRLQKFRSLQSVVGVFGGKGRDPEDLPRAPVAVTFPSDGGDDRPYRNRAGVWQPRCTLCGDCVSGCNYGAKNTLIMNYLPVARAHGAQLFTEVKVTSVQPRSRDPRGSDGARWTVRFEFLGSGRDRLATTELSITARTVVLAAGVLGTTEILLRSADEGRLALSDRLGERFSTNGDVLAFAYNNLEPVNAIGLGRHAPESRPLPGPCISGYIRWPEENPRILLQEGVIPGALSPILALGFMLARLVGGGGADRPGAPPGRGLSIWRFLQALRSGVASTQTFLAMVHDTRYGRLVREGDRVRVKWSGAGSEPVYHELRDKLREAAGALGGWYIASPFGLVTVHPLGGCVMGDSPDEGVVDDMGAVFDPTSSDPQRPCHEGLYVCDASIIPGPLVANPLLTITALAERAATHIS